MLGIDPSYFTPLEAAMVSHFSLVKGSWTLGLLAWMVLLPLVLMITVNSCVGRSSCCCTGTFVPGKASNVGTAGVGGPPPAPLVAEERQDVSPDALQAASSLRDIPLR